MKVRIKKKLKPIKVVDGQPHLTKGVTLSDGHTDLPEGTLIKRVIYYGSRGPRQTLYSIDNGETWAKGFYWSDLPLSEGTEVRYV